PSAECLQAPGGISAVDAIVLMKALPGFYFAVMGSLDPGEPTLARSKCFSGYVVQRKRAMSSECQCVWNFLLPAQAMSAMARLSPANDAKAGGLPSHARAG